MHILTEHQLFIFLVELFLLLFLARSAGVLFLLLDTGWKSTSPLPDGNAAKH
jgi:hypothetical protein